MKLIHTRQIENPAALPNIGSGPSDPLDDILARIDAVLAGITSGAEPYIAKKVALTVGTTSQAVTIPALPDTSYIVLAMMENAIDSLPQFQQVEVSNKTTTGFTFQWDAPLASSNYSLNFIVPPLDSAVVAEKNIPISTSDYVETLGIPKNGPNYGIVGVLQNRVDPFPQFQSVVVTNQAAATFTASINAPTSTGNYYLTYLASPTGQIAVGSGVNSITASLPVDYGTTDYAVMAVLSNVTEAYPQFQPLLITNKTSTQFTVKLNANTVSNDYLLTYYAISLTA